MARRSSRISHHPQMAARMRAGTTRNMIVRRNKSQTRITTTAAAVNPSLTIASSTRRPAHRHVYCWLALSESSAACKARDSAPF